MENNGLTERIRIFNKIRDIPYAITPGLTRPEHARRALMTNKGFCYQKHFLLGELFLELGLSVLYEVSLFAWQEFSPLFPEHLKRLAQNLPPDFHLSCLVEINNEFILVDATLDSPLQKLGLRVNRWDGLNNTPRSSTPLSPPTLYHPSESRLKENKPKASKEALAFYKELNAWLQTARTNQNPDP